MRAVLALLLALSGCFKPTPQEGFACGPSSWCPDPLHCASDGTCRRTEQGTDAAIATDDGHGTGLDSDPSQPNLAFVISTPLTARSLGGPAAADAMCTAVAGAHGHPGTFVAWISTAANSVRNRLGAARGWVRTDGRPFADRIADLVAGTIYYPLRKNEQGGDTVLPVMTGTGNDGVGNGEDCNAFTSSLDTDLMSLGASDAGTNRWTQNAELGCTQLFGVYCLQIDHDFQLAAPTEQGPIAFESTATFTPGGGLAGADALCQGEATAAGLSGTFRALLATTTASAISRFTPLPATPWVRRDGVATTADFTSWDAPIDVTAAGKYVDDIVFAGAPSPTAVAASGADNCNNWLTSNGASSRTGYAALAGPEAFGANSGSCGPHRILCLQH